MDHGLSGYGFRHRLGQESWLQTRSSWVLIWSLISLIVSATCLGQGYQDLLFYLLLCQILIVWGLVYATRIRVLHLAKPCFVNWFLCTTLCHWSTICITYTDHATLSLITMNSNYDGTCWHHIDLHWLTLWCETRLQFLIYRHRESHP